jgi:hypothetical protein
VRTAEKLLDRGLPARVSELPNWRKSLPARGGKTSLTISYLPADRVGRCMDRFPAESIVAFVSPKRSMDASHVGLVFKRGGASTLRHASSTRRKVVDESLLLYLKRRGKHILGVAVLRLRGKAAPTEISAPRR